MIELALPLLATTAAAVGIAQACVGLLALVGHLARPSSRPVTMPGVTIMKPLCGTEPLLEDALASFFRQDYPLFQIVFAVHDRGDPACSVVERLRARYPDIDVAVVADAALHGRNRKISNLINSQGAAKHDVLVISDSDVHVPTGHLKAIVAELERNVAGLVTSGYHGLAANPSLAARFGRMQVDLAFLPGVLLGRRLGRQDCLGAIMALRRETLARVGGLEALRDHVDDDNRLGRLVRAAGGRVALLPGIVAVTVPETSFRELFVHELRWGRTIRMVAPVEHACSVLQYPLFWAGTAVACSGLARWPVAVLAVAWAARAVIAGMVARSVLPRSGGPPTCVDLLVLLPREIMSVAVVAASFCGTRVRWRGVRIDLGPPIPPRRRLAARSAAAARVGNAIRLWFPSRQAGRARS